jgi:hypothetical protein
MPKDISTGSRRNHPLLIELFIVVAFLILLSHSVLAWSSPTQAPPGGAPSALSLPIGGTGATTTSQALLDLGAAASGANTDITSLTPSGSVSLQIGNAGVLIGQSFYINNAQGGSMELGGNATGSANTFVNTSGATPYIDFHYGTGTAQDYNVRIINNANNSLGIYSSGSLTLNTGSTSTDSVVVGSGLGTVKSGTVQFSGGTTQTTAASGGVPSGSDVLSASSAAPSGYTYTGTAMSISGTTYYVMSKN